MRYLSVCSGIEAATVAWHPLGWQPAAFAEVERFPSAVLAYHYPDVPNRGDMTRFKDWPDAAIDVLVGGTPCQSFSVAGLRAGLADPRGNLALTYLAVARRYRPHWLVWENVPGVLSSGDGRDFGSFLSGLAGWDIPIPPGGWQNSGIVNAAPTAGSYGLAWRCVDAQYVGLAQRRLRVFVVGHLGDWRRAAAVLFERESLSGHPAPRREAGQDVTGSLAARASAGGGLGTDFDCGGGLIPLNSLNGASHALTARHSSTGRYDPNGETFIAHALRADGFDASEDGTGRGTPLIAETAPTLGQRMRGPIDSMFDGALIAQPLRAGRQYSDMGDGSANIIPVAYGIRSDAMRSGEAKTPSPDAEGRVRLRDAGFNIYKDLAPTIDAGTAHSVAFQESQSGFRATDAHPTLDSHNGSRRHHGALIGMQVRRLTPCECERLQGFPDNYTLIPYGRPSKRKLEEDYIKYLMREVNGVRLTREECYGRAADGPRYKALGNSMAVPVMAWIGRRIALVDALKLEQAIA